MANLLPPNATPFERKLAQVNSGLGELPAPHRTLMNPDACPENLLPWLAASLSVDTWDPAWAVVQKRGAIKSSLQVHRLKGTIGAVKRVLASLGHTVEVQEWFNQLPAGAPFTFRLLLKIDQNGISQKGLQSIQRVTHDAKNLRSHLSDIATITTTRAGPVVTAATNLGNEVTVRFGGGGLISDGSVIDDGAYRANAIKLKMN